MEKSVIEKIHSEFNDSFIVAEEQLFKSIDLLKITVDDKNSKENDFNYNTISKYFLNSESIVKRNEIKSKEKKYVDNLEDHTLFLKEIEKYKNMYPNNRLIAYSQIDDILKRWDLYMGISSRFIGEIPTENAKQIAEYIKSATNNNANNFINFKVDQPTFSPFNNNISSSSTPSLYICAPMDHFDSKNMQICEREIYYSEGPKFKMIPATIMDPIVISPLRFSSNIGRSLRIFHVVSAWGPESKDEYLVGKSKF